jgi:hypothetical protein
MWDGVTAGRLNISWHGVNETRTTSVGVYSRDRSATAVTASCSNEGKEFI